MSSYPVFMGVVFPIGWRSEDLELAATLMLKYGEEATLEMLLTEYNRPALNADQVRCLRQIYGMMGFKTPLTP